jgi:hypothetical protein
MREDHKMAAALRPEAELLVCCARTCYDSQTIERIKALLDEEIDWVYLIRLMLAHGMLPLLYTGLRQVCPEAVHPSTMDQLRRQYEASTNRNAFMTEELITILELFETHGIVAAPFKGPALAAFAYADLSLRQFGDLDILVKKEDVFKASELLASRFYEPQSKLTDAEREAHLLSKYVFSFLNPNNRISVELHWGITPKYFSFPIKMDELWQRLGTVSLAGEIVPSLPPEKLLLILCVHGSKHHWERLAWICDIAEMIRVHKEMDWDSILREADRLGVKRMLCLGLFLAGDLLGAEFPEKVSKQIRSDLVITKLAACVRKRLFEDAGVPVESAEIPVSKDGLMMSLIHFHLRSRERLRDRIRYCLHLGRLTISPTKKDRVILRLPESLSFLYYLSRPVRLVAEYGFRPFMRTLMHLLGRQGI